MSRRMRFIALAAAASIMMPGSLYPGTFTVADPPQNLGTPVNSEKNDFAPTLSPDGSYMIFNSNRNGAYQDLFISYYKDGAWQTPKPLTRLNSPYNDESPFLSFDGTTLLFSSDRDGSCELPRDESGTVRVSFDLYRSRLVNGEWTVPERLPGQVNTAAHEKSPSLSRDGKTLYYCMWPFGDIARATLMTAAYRGEEEGFCDPKPMPAPLQQRVPRPRAHSGRGSRRFLFLLHAAGLDRPVRFVFRFM